MRIRQYSGPLTVLAMGTLGFSLFCIVSAVALAGADAAHPVSIAPQNIVDSAFSNLNTMAALTDQVISQYVFTPTATPSFAPTFTSSSTSTLFVSPTRTSVPPTRTRGPGAPPTITKTPTRVPSHTPTPIPPTNTPLPTFTPIPDTDTPVPTETAIPDTPVPSDTAVPANTVEPTSTSAPIQESPIPPVP